jgi:hypothetical protein
LNHSFNIPLFLSSGLLVNWKTGSSIIGCDFISRWTQALCYWMQFYFLLEASSLYWMKFDLLLEASSLYWMKFDLLLEASSLYWMKFDLLLEASSFVIR